MAIVPVWQVTNAVTERSMNQAEQNLANSWNRLDLNTFNMYTDRAFGVPYTNLENVMMLVTCSFHSLAMPGVASNPPKESGFEVRVKDPGDADWVTVGCRRHTLNSQVIGESNDTISFMLEPGGQYYFQALGNETPELIGITEFAFSARHTPRTWTHLEHIQDLAPLQEYFAKISNIGQRQGLQDYIDMQGSNKQIATTAQLFTPRTDASLVNGMEDLFIKPPGDATPTRVARANMNGGVFILDNDAEISLSIGATFNISSRFGKFGTATSETIYTVSPGETGVSLGNKFRESELNVINGVDVSETFPRQLLTFVEDPVGSGIFVQPAGTDITANSNIIMNVIVELDPQNNDAWAEIHIDGVLNTRILQEKKDLLHEGAMSTVVPHGAVPTIVTQNVTVNTVRAYYWELM